MYTVSVNCFSFLSLSSASRDYSGWIEVRQWWRNIWLFLVILCQHRLSSSDHVSAWLRLILFLVSGSSLFALIIYFQNICWLKYYLPSTLWRWGHMEDPRMHVGLSSGVCVFPIMTSVEVSGFVCCCDFLGCNLV